MLIMILSEIEHEIHKVNINAVAAAAMCDDAAKVQWTIYDFGLSKSI